MRIPTDNRRRCWYETICVFYRLSEH